MVLRRRRDWDPAKPLRPWLSSIAFRVVLAHRRRSAARGPARADRRRGRLSPGRREGRRGLDPPEGARGPRRAAAQAARGAPAARDRRAVDEGDRPVARAAGVHGLLPPAHGPDELRQGGPPPAPRRREPHEAGGSPAPAPAGPQPAAAPPEVKRRVLERLADWATSRRAGPRRLRAKRPRRRSPRRAGGRPRPLVAGTLAGLHAIARPAVSGGAGRSVGGPGPIALAARPEGPRWPAFRPPALQAPRANLAIRRGGRARGAGLARGLVAYWRFDEPEGAPAARDLSGHGGDCQLRRSNFVRSSRGRWGAPSACGPGPGWSVRPRRARRASPPS